MHFLKLLALCASAALANPVPAAQDDVPAAADVKIVSVVWNGSGCHMGGTSGSTAPPADTAYIMSGDRRTLTILYSKYVAQSGIRLQPDIPRTNCLINIEVSYPKNWRYSISQTTFHGYI
jgi:hypothetical protein